MKYRAVILIYSLILSLLILGIVSDTAIARQTRSRSKKNVTVVPSLRYTPIKLFKPTRSPAKLPKISLPSFSRSRSGGLSIINSTSTNTTYNLHYTLRSTTPSVPSKTPTALPVQRVATPAPNPAPNPTVWLNTKSGIYWYSGSRYYGKTKEGRFLPEQDAMKAGYRPGLGQVTPVVTPSPVAPPPAKVTPAVSPSPAASPSPSPIDILPDH